MPKRVLGAWFAALVCTFAQGVLAEESSGPSPSVVFTLTGEIGRSNRGPLDPFLDKMMVHQGTKFEQAFEFDYAALDALGTQKVTVRGPNWPAAQEFEGPLVRDVLFAADVSSGELQPIGLDGYAPEIPYSDLEKWPVILATKMNGRRLAVGGAGPVWVIYPRGNFPELAQDDDSKWVWGISHMRVGK